jgi:2,4-dienoyl-CoA reductase-like NADH-dependent reductase (Old Yellow Enzyme family)
VPLRLGSSVVAKTVSALLLGTPREMNHADISTVISQFTYAARMAAATGFQGVQIHAAHGYLLAQFLSDKVNLRADEYGGSSAARAKLVVDIIRAVRAATPSGFCVSVKLNSVDHQSKSALRDCVQQLRLIVDAGIDFVEISGGTWEDPKAGTIALVYWRAYPQI